MLSLKTNSGFHGDLGQTRVENMGFRYCMANEAYKYWKQLLRQTHE